MVKTKKGMLMDGRHRDTQEPRCTAGSPVALKLICLANSRKRSGRCIAGKEWHEGRPGRWVRPLGAGPQGAWTPHDLELNGGEGPDLLDVISVPVGKAVGPAHQPENVILRAGSVQRVGRYPLEKLEDLCDSVDTLWINGHSSSGGWNDRMPLEEAQRAAAGSLLFIRPNHFALRVEPQNKIWAVFDFCGISYRLSVTDPKMEKVCRSKRVGNYRVPGRIYLTVSLSEEHRGYVYKLVAAVLRATEDGGA